MKTRIFSLCLRYAELVTFSYSNSVIQSQSWPEPECVCVVKISVYNVYFRFLKIMVIVPFGAIAGSTLAGNRGISNTFVNYMKYFISVVFEAVIMALAILLCNIFISSGLPEFTGNYADWAKTLIYLGEMTFTVALTVGSVKGAQNLTSRALGL